MDSEDQMPNQTCQGLRCSCGCYVVTLFNFWLLRTASLELFFSIFPCYQLIENGFLVLTFLLCSYMIPMTLKYCFLIFVCSLKISLAANVEQCITHLPQPGKKRRKNTRRKPSMFSLEHTHARAHTQKWRNTGASSYNA